MMLLQLAIFVIAVSVIAVDAGCGPHHQRKEAMCCQGRNNTCVAHGPRMNHKHANQKRCYCDESCLKLGDCCTDYPQHCNAVDCVLGDWGDYSTCDRPCGIGTATRERPIVVARRNGGKNCGTRTQKRVCFGRRCKTQRGLRHKIQRETARIIPAKFGGWRSNVKYDISKDIRRNLFFHYTFNKLEKRPTYCATFRITNSRRNCVAPYGTEWSKVLQRGQTICVECQQMAMHKDLGVRCRGHGVHRMETRWNAVKASGCHGKWEMIEYHKECSCGNGPSDFIFI